MSIEHILIVEPDKAVRDFLVTALAEWDCQVQVADGAMEAVSRSANGGFDLMLASPDVARGQWCSWHDALRQGSPRLLTVAIVPAGTSPAPATGEPLEVFAVLQKPVDRDSLLGMLERAERYIAVLNATQYLIEEQHGGFMPLVAFSSRMRQALGEAQRLAWSLSPVLIRGEPGTEQRSMARFIHEHSPVADGLFVEVDCSMDGGLLEVRLFGRERSAELPGGQVGLVEVASGGTLYLDRFEHCPECVQRRLVRLFDEGVWQRLDGTRQWPAQARVVAGVSHDLYVRLAHGDFRKDLFFRFGPATLEIPPLRERTEDLAGLAALVLRQTGAQPDALTPAALERLQAYPWPGNVAELTTTLQAAVWRSGGKALAPENLAVPLDAAQKPESVEPLADVERRCLRRALESAAGDHTEAARLLRLSPRGFATRLRRCGLSDVAARVARASKGSRVNSKQHVRRAR